MSGRVAAVPGASTATRGEGARPPAARARREGVAVPGDLLLALGVLGLAAFFAYGALQIRVSPAYAYIGPRFFPWLVAAGLAACGLGLAWEALRAPRPAREPLDWAALGTVAGCLVAQALLLRPAGFVLASALLFTGTARAFGSRRPARDALLGLLLAGAAYLAFTRLLGLALPAGEWWRALLGGG